ncbi:hypothetical protein LCGC14_1784820, partial [marine sediment metagenome]
SRSLVTVHIGNGLIGAGVGPQDVKMLVDTIEEEMTSRRRRGF